MTATLASARPEATAAGRRALVTVYSATAAIGSALLFLVEPMMARQLLPRLGGSAAIWNTAMVFFQGALLVGYLVAHVAQQRLHASRRVAIVALLVAGVAPLPLALPDWAPPTGGGQAWWVLGTLAVSVGLPFVGLATLSPTLQRWFADTDHPQADDPYFLYAAGNVGSVVGLLAYPIVVEPLLGLADQRRLWSVGYVVTIALCIACARLRARSVPSMTGPSRSHGEQNELVGGVGGPSWGDRLRWIGLAAVPSGLLLGVTRHLSTDVAAVPLLWVLPLLAYLATFVVAFRSGAAPSERLLRGSLLVSLPLVATMAGGVGSAVVAVAIGVAGFTLLALVCHARLAADRPATEHLTAYYLWISFGGAVGGVSVAMIAPVVFTRVTEYPLLIVAALAVVAWSSPRPTALPATRRLPLPAIVAAVCATCVWLSHLGPERAARITQVLGVGAGIIYLVAREPRRIALAVVALVATTVVVDNRAALLESRTFFGVYRVRVDDRDRHVFEHGTTIHGEQIFDPEPQGEPLTYYTRGSGIGRVFGALQQSDRHLSVGVVGLGAGTLATYGRPGDHIDFYEIDGEVVRIARDPALFTFLRDSPADVTTTVGDGRLELGASTRPLDLLVLDAFSSDAIPVHLLTAEAMTEYRRHLAPGGVIAVHISNRFFDLGPIVSRLGQHLDMAAHRLDTPVSSWMLLTPTDAPVGVRAEVRDWKAITAGRDVPLWTDDFSNLLSALQ